MLLEALELPLKVSGSAFKMGIAAASASVAALVAGMGLAIKATFKWADEMDAMQDVMGITNKEAAALNFTLRKSGTDTETFTKGMVILGKGLVDSKGKLDVTGKALKSWGINVLDANGVLKDQVTLVDEISNKYNTFATQQEKVNFLTETFGKSGAGLIDFFDTLAADGGIDAVAAKVERLGLAIDPNRYEQFNRNLEELKLVGLGLAVNFTEKVMPVIEKFLEMISDPKGIDVSKILAWADNTIASFIKGLGDSINNWVSSGGPEAFSEALISWIEGIGDSDAAKSKTQIAMEHLVKAMGDALANIDWAGVWAAIDAKLDELDPIVLAAIDNAFIKADEAIKNALIRINATFNNWVATDVTNALNNFDATTQQKVNTAMSNLLANERTGLANAAASFSTWATSTVPAALSSFGANITNVMQTALSQLKVSLNSKLTDIAKEFYARGTGWANQAAQGFEAGKQVILGKIREIVGLINAILKKIITSFTLTFSMPSLPSWMGGGGGGGGVGGGTNSSHPRPNSGRASGGPVIGGQSYNVAEFFKPERFTPNVSGRIDPMQQQTVNAVIDEGRLARTIVTAMMQAWNSG